MFYLNVTRSCLFWLIISIITPPYALFVIIFGRLMPIRSRYDVVVAWSKMFIILSKYICGINYIVNGKSNIPAEHDITVIVSNHQSMWETFAFTVIFPRHTWILKQELLKIPLFGWALSTIKPIAVNRLIGMPMQQVIHQFKHKIKDGFWILIFPGGTRNTCKAKLQYKAGFAKLASELNLPILPVKHDAGCLMPKGSFILRAGTITVEIKPVIPAPSSDQITEYIEHVMHLCED